MSFRFFLEDCGPLAVTCNSESSAYVLFFFQGFNLKIVHYTTFVFILAMAWTFPQQKKTMEVARFSMYS